MKALSFVIALFFISISAQHNNKIVASKQTQCAAGDIFSRTDQALDILNDPKTTKISIPVWLATFNDKQDIDHLKLATIQQLETLQSKRLDLFKLLNNKELFDFDTDQEIKDPTQDIVAQQILARNKTYCFIGQNQQVTNAAVGLWGTATAQLSDQISDFDRQLKLMHEKKKKNIFDIKTLKTKFIESNEQYNELTTFISKASSATKFILEQQLQIVEKQKELLAQRIKNLEVEQQELDMLPELDVEHIQQTTEELRNKYDDEMEQNRLLERKLTDLNQNIQLETSQIKKSQESLMNLSLGQQGLQKEFENSTARLKRLSSLNITSGRLQANAQFQEAQQNQNQLNKQQVD